MTDRFDRPDRLDYDRLAADYARHRRVHPAVLRDLLTTGQVSPGSRVLEVGCGTGNYAVAVQSAAGCRCWGIDPSEEMLARAQSRSAAIDLRRGRAEQLDFPDATFDLVFSVDVIHHVADLAAHYREAYRVLRPGGAVCTVTDSERIIRQREPLASYWPETVEVELRRYPPISELRRLTSEAGFGGVAEREVEWRYDLADAGPYRARTFSSLHLIPEDAFRRGLERLEVDLLVGSVRCVSRYTVLWGVK